MPGAFPVLRDRLGVWAQLDELLAEPEFDRSLTGVSITYRRLQKFGRLLGPAREIHRDPARMLAGMEWAGVVDPTMMHAAMVHYAVCTSSLVECGNPNDDLDALVSTLDTMEAPGVIVATELGRGGSQVSMRTEARYCHERDVFTLHTPDAAALKIMPNVGWLGLPRVAVVNARLIVDGSDHGVHAFAFRFPNPGTRVTALPGSAPVPLDYSVIRFEGAQIPRGYWLSDNARIVDGTVEDPLSPVERLGRSLGGVNAAIVSASVALTAAARAAVATAARFNIQRVIGESGTRALDFVTHQSELYSALARVYATQLFTERVRREFIAERRGESTPKPAKAAISADYAPWVAAYRERTLVKVAAAETLEAVAATCRRLCGFQGVLHANRLSVFEDMARSFHAAGGDSRLLLLEAGKQLLGADAGVPSLPGALGTGIGDARSALRLVSRHERMLTGELAARVERAGGAGRLDVHGWNPHLPQLEELARVHITRRILEEFDEAIASGEDSWREAMDAVRCLYGIDVLLKSAAWHLNHGSLRPGDLDVLRYAHTNAVGRVGRSLDSLLDGLAVPPGRVGGFIGRTDYVSRVASLLQ